MANNWLATIKTDKIVVMRKFGVVNLLKSLSEMLRQPPKTPKSRLATELKAEFTHR